MNRALEYVPKATAYLAAANTPLYLINSIRQDAGALEFAKAAKGNDLVNDIVGSLGKAPATIEDEVEPFVCMVALAIKGDARNLLKVTQIDTDRRWFSYCAKFLYDRSATQSVFTIPAASATQFIAKVDGNNISPSDNRGVSVSRFTFGAHK